MTNHLELEHWLRGRCEELAEESSDKKSALIEVRSGLGALNVDLLQHLTRTVELNVFFNLLQTSNNDVVEISTDVIYVLLNSLPDVEALSTYNAQIAVALTKDNNHVKRTFLKLLHEHLNAQSLVILSTHRPEILACLLNCFADVDRGIAEGAVKLFKKIGATVQGIQLLYSKNFLELLKSKMTNDISRFRTYEIAVDIAVNSLEGLQEGHNCGLLPSLLNELKSEDMLLQLNALELLTSLTANKDGLLYLQREGAIKYLVDRIINVKQEPLSFIILPGLIEFFGNLYQHQPTVFSQQHPEVLDLLLDCFDTLDPALLGVVISTLGKIGSSDEGKKVLGTKGEKVNVVFTKLGTIIARKDELSITAMNSISVLVCCNSLELNEIVVSWFNSIGKQPLENIVTAAKLPFVELRLAALNLLKAVSMQQWGVSQICNYPGLVEFLLDRNAEFDKICKNTKYDIINALSNNSATPTAVTGVILLKLRQFVNEGPFYVPTEPTMAFEGAN